MTTIETKCFGIVVTLSGDGGGKLTSDLKEGGPVTEDDSAYEAAMDGIESMILAHAVAGIDITDPKYLEGIETAVESCSNAFL
jgi:hypothetical protein